MVARAWRGVKAKTKTKTTTITTVSWGKKRTQNEAKKSETSKKISVYTTVDRALAYPVSNNKF